MAAPPPPLFVFREHTAAVTSVSFSADACCMLSGDADGLAIVWDVRRRRLIYRWNAHEKDVLTTQFIPGTLNYILTHGQDNSLKIWKIPAVAASDSQPALLATMTTLASGYCRASITAINDQSWLIAIASASENNMIKIDIFHLSRDSWRFHPLVTGMGEGGQKKQGMVMATALINGDIESQVYVLAGYEAGCVVLWRVDGRKACLILELLTNGRRTLKQIVLSLSISPLRRVFVITSATREVVLMRLQLQTSDTPAYTKVINATLGMSCAAFQASGKFFATGGWDGKIRVFSKSFKPLAILDYHRDSIQDIAFSPNDNYCISSDRTFEHANSKDRVDDTNCAAIYGLMACSSKDGRISLWKLY